MSQQDGQRQVKISEEAYQELRSLKEQAGAPAAGVSARQLGTGMCGGSIIFGPDGDIIAFRCGGNCGFIDRILGRSCHAASAPSSGGGSVLFCECSGGWFDRIFGA